MLYTEQLAYRHGNGEVEGFIGYGDTKAKAAADTIEQIKRKVDILSADNAEEPGFDKARVIRSPSTLTKAEQATVIADWRSNAKPY